MNIRTERAVKAGLRYMAHYHEKGAATGNHVEYKLMVRDVKEIFRLEDRGAVKCKTTYHHAGH
jgi:hypothetical protein